MRKVLVYLSCVLLLITTSIPGYAADDLLINFFDFYESDSIDEFYDTTIYDINERQEITVYENDSIKTNNEIENQNNPLIEIKTQKDNNQKALKQIPLSETIPSNRENSKNSEIKKNPIDADLTIYDAETRKSTIYLEDMRKDEQNQKTDQISQLEEIAGPGYTDFSTLLGPTGVPIGESGKYIKPTKSNSTQRSPRRWSFANLLGPSGKQILVGTRPSSSSQGTFNPSLDEGTSYTTPVANTPTSALTTVVGSDPTITERKDILQDRNKSFSNNSFRLSEEEKQATDGNENDSGNIIPGIRVNKNIGDRKSKAFIREGTSVSSIFGKIKNGSEIAIEDNAIIDKEIANKELLGATMLGSYDDHLVFSKPVLIQIPVDSSVADGENIEVLVYHLGDEKFTAKGLTNNPDAICYPDGNVSDNEHIAKVSGGYASIYTCGASIFVVTYTGGATSDNFVDNATITKTITVNPGDVTAGAGAVITDMTVSIDFHSIDGVDWTTPGTGNSYSSELYINLQSPSGTTISLLDYFTYSNNGPASRVTVTFDDTAGSPPSGLPSNGTFTSSDLLSSFDNEDPVGDWIVTFGDAVNDDGVILYEVDLSIDAELLCGNGVIETGEGCDDSNQTNGDGCNDVCLVENNTACNTSGPGLLNNESCVSGVCDQNETTPRCEAAGVCGNGLVEGAEQCDDGNTTSGDGCSNTCVLTYCGNGELDATVPVFGTIMQETFETIGNGTISLDGSTIPTSTHTIIYNNSGANSRLRYGNTAVQTNGGGGAATLDVSVTGTNRINYLTFQVDLSRSASATDLELSFDRSDHGEEVNANDRVWIRGSDTDGFIEVYDWSANQAGNGVYQTVSGIDIDAVLAGGGQIPTSTFQVRIGQEDNFNATSTTASDGLSIDNVQIVGSVATGPAVSETCDDGNDLGGDGCSATCQIEAGYTCSETLPSVCTAPCNSKNLINTVILNSVNQNFQTVLFNTITSHTYSTPPIVIATPQTENSTNNYPIPRIRNVTTTGFEISLCLDNGSTTCAASPTPENFAIFIIDTDKASCLNHIEAGTTTIATDGNDTAFTFANPFTNAPYVFTTPQTSNQGNNIAAIAWVDDNALSVNGSDFVGCVHQAGSSGNVNTCTTGQPNETLGWVAIDPVLFTYPGFKTGTQSIRNSTWTTVNFTPAYTTTPGVMVTQNSDNGGQDPQYARAKNVTSSNADIRYCEADGIGDCDNHGGEDVMRFSLDVITCGNGIIGAGETCDDANTTSGDGCSSSCAIEPGYVCSGTPSVCLIPLVNSCSPGLYLDDDLSGNYSTGDSLLTGGTGNGVRTGYFDVTPGGFGLIEIPIPFYDDGVNVYINGTEIFTESQPDFFSPAIDSPWNVNTNGLDRLIISLENGNVTLSGSLTTTSTLYTALAPTNGITNPTLIDGQNEVVLSITNAGGAGGGSFSLDYTCNNGTCGDGYLGTSESCDDGNPANGDGCSSTCEIETGFSCDGLPSVCNSGCGDGTVGGTEECDDSNNTSGDGCSAACKIEYGFICPVASNCGNGIIDEGEQCDDGGIIDGDGCSQYCIEEFNIFLAEFTGESLLRTPPDAGGGLDEPIRIISGSGYEASVDPASNPYAHVFYSPVNFWSLAAPRAVELAFQGASDDDFIGYAFSFEPGDWDNPDADFLLVTWKDIDQTFDFTDDPIGGGQADAGLSVIRVQGQVSYDEIWQRIDSPNTTGSVTELARGTTYGNAPYRPNLYDTSVFYDTDKLEVYVNGVKDISINGSFEDGRFGIFVLAQQGNTFALGRPHPYALGGACYALCGDGIIAGAEECDDGNAIGGDGCSDFCSIEGVNECLLGIDKCNTLETCIDSFLGYECVCEIGDCSGGVEPPVLGTGDVCIAGPNTYSFGSVETNNTIGIFTGAILDYFEVEDTLGADSGYYTTLEITDFTGAVGTLNNALLEWKSDGVDLLTGTVNTNVELATGWNSFRSADSTYTFIKRDSGANGGVTGTYGSLLDLRITIPPYTKPSTYTATIYYTLYEN